MANGQEPIGFFMQDFFGMCTHCTLQCLTCVCVDMWIWVLGSCATDFCQLDNPDGEDGSKMVRRWFEDGSVVFCPLYQSKKQTTCNAIYRKAAKRAFIALLFKHFSFGLGEPCLLPVPPFAHAVLCHSPF
jgi:hypothetical protein